MQPEPKTARIVATNRMNYTRFQITGDCAMRMTICQPWTNPETKREETPMGDIVHAQSQCINDQYTDSSTQSLT